MSTQYYRLNETAEKISKQLFTQEEWNVARFENEKLGLCHAWNSMMNTVYNAVYQSNPELFEDAKQINDEFGQALWVRPQTTNSI